MFHSEDVKGCVIAVVAGESDKCVFWVLARIVGVFSDTHTYTHTHTHT